MCKWFEIVPELWQPPSLEIFYQDRFVSWIGLVYFSFRVALLVTDNAHRQGLQFFEIVIQRVLVILVAFLVDVLVSLGGKQNRSTSRGKEGNGSQIEVNRKGKERK